MVDMDFKQRASLLLHVAGFAIGVLVLPFAVFELFNYYDFGRGFEEASTLLLIGLISPIAGWILRWLISGEWSSFIPLVDDVFKPMVNALINALPKEGWSSSVLLLVIIGSPLVLYNLEKNFNQEQWESNVFGMQCTDSQGNEAVLDTFAIAEGATEGKPIYCSHYLEKTRRGETLCTWDDNANAYSPRCTKLAENPKPKPADTLLLLTFSFFISLFALILLTAINLIINHRKKSQHEGKLDDL
jgi:hypothetical protein